MVRALNKKIKIFTILTFSILVLCMSAAQAKIDVTICQYSKTEADTMTQNCIDQCSVTHAATIQQIANLPTEPASCNQLSSCAQSMCSNVQIETDEDTSIGVGWATMVGAVASCAQQSCPDLYQQCIDDSNDLQKQKADLQQTVYACYCADCILPACRYYNFDECDSLVAECDLIRQNSLGAKYPSSRKSWIGCDSSAAQAALLTKIAANATTSSTQTTTTSTQTTIKAEAEKIIEEVSEKTLSGKSKEREDAADKLLKEFEEKYGDGGFGKALDQAIETELDDISMDGASLKEIAIEAGITDEPEKGVVKIEKTQDKLAMDLRDKVKYTIYQATREKIKNAVGELPGVKYFSDNVGNFLDDTLMTKKEKVYENKEKYKTDDYGGLAMTRYNDDMEKTLAPAKSFIEDKGGTLIAAPAKALNELGSTYKKEVAKSGSDMYKTIGRLIQDKKDMGIDDQRAIELAKEDFVDGEYYKGVHGKGGNVGLFTRIMNTLSGKPTNDPNDVFDTAVSDLKEAGKI